MLLLSLSVCQLKIGFDFNSDFESNGYTNNLDMGFFIGFESPANDDNKTYYGIEYLFPTDLDDSNASLALLTIYGKYKFMEDENLSCFGKLGYTFPELNFDDDYYNVDISGGFMYGIELSFDNISFSYTINNGEIGIPEYYYYGYYSGNSDHNITMTRMSASYSF